MLVIAGGADDGGDVIDKGGIEEGETRVDGMEPEGPGPVPGSIPCQQCIPSNGRDFRT